MNERKYDVVVVGGGMAGISAAICAARAGAKTLLVERHPYVGGAFTAGMVTHMGGLTDHRSVVADSDTTHNPDNWIVQGLAREFHAALDECGAAHGVQWDHEAGKMVLDQKLEGAGVDVLYGTQFFSADRDGEHICRVHLIHRITKISVESGVFIDASGDGDLGAAAGVQFHLGREVDGAMMPATLSYMVCDIDWDQYQDDGDDVLRQAVQKDEIPREMRPGIIGRRFCEGRVRDEMWCSIVRQWGNITDPWQYSRMERRGRAVGWQIFRYLKSSLKGWQDAYLGSIGHQIWPRECRHLKTHHAITEDDVRRPARFDDVIARGAFYLDLHAVQPGSIGFDLEWHPPEYDQYFEIPYRSLVADGVSNLLLAGRTIGADHVGHSATRVMGTGIATGQAAGVAAALLAASGATCMDMDVTSLQNKLRQQGVLI